MGFISISQEILDRVNLLKEYRGKLKSYADKKSKALAEYDKALALVLIGLKNGKEYTVDGVTISNPPVSSADKIAKGIVYQEKLDMELADAELKALYTAVSCLETEASCLQSILKITENM